MSAKKRSKRQPYRESRRFDYSCRNHGSCERCRDGRLKATYVNNDKARDELRELRESA